MPLPRMRVAQFLSSNVCLEIFRFGIKGHVPCNTCSVSSLTGVSGWSSEDNDDFDGENYDDNVSFRLTMIFVMIYTIVK